jgi:hypothetical protein
MSRRRLFLIALFALAPPLAACAPQPGGGTTTTTTQPDEWPGATCLDGAGTDGAVAPDLYFTGTPGVRGNAIMSGSFSNGAFVLSGNGSCAGLQVAATTIVRADSQAEATEACTALNAGTEAATTYAGSPWTLPADAWACSETYFL